MPLSPGSDKRPISKNISEFHHGPTFERTKAKFGAAAADRQAVAVAMSNARKTGHHHKRPKTRLAHMR